ncbi:unnamed protein product [Caenorhabditis brenneri]
MEVKEEQPLCYKCPVSTVFNNLDLLAKILGEVTDDIRNNLELRLVNRKFRDACHANLRKNHRNLKIEYIFVFSKDPDTEMITNNRVYINYRRVPVLNVYRESFKKLIGMDQICHGNCDACLWIPNGCVEYGPLQFETLRKSFTEPHVFEKLIVPDYLLDDIANSCVFSTNSKDDCLKAASDLISSKISCKTLILKMSETRKEWIDPEMNDIQGRRRTEDHQAMPREILEFMLKQWNVQSVVLKFVRKNHREEHAGEWTRMNWFTELRFKGSRIHVNISDPSLKIKEVLVDLTDSNKCNSHLNALYLTNFSMISYTDLPSIIRRVFLNDKLKIQFSHYVSGTYYEMFHVTEFMMKNINADAPRNLEVEIISFLRFKSDIEYLDELLKEETQMRSAVFQDFQISNLPNAIKISHRKVDCKDPPYYPIAKKEWIGKCCQMINRKRNCNIKWTFFANEDTPNRNDSRYRNH